MVYYRTNKSMPLDPVLNRNLDTLLL